ncbi:MAG: M48 family metallopeptidase [Desulfobacterales bacterium]|jgi:STE24 endopeptidase
MIEITPLLLAYLGLAAIGQWIEILAEKFQARRIVQRRGQIPEALNGWIDATGLARIEQYNLDRLRFARRRSLANGAAFVVLLVSGFLPALADRMAEWGDIAGGLGFFAVVGGILFAVDLPFDYWHAFVLEERHGFNTRTKRIWLVDTLKTIVLSGVLFAAVLSALLLLMRTAGPSWWLPAWAVVIAFQTVMALVYPTLIAPWFNKFTPVDDPDLRGRIQALAERAGVRIRGIDQMDASKRTRHTNAYFAGLGKTRRIVLYDSLLAAHETDEVLSILAHEIGHLKKRHIPKQLAMWAAAGLAMFAAAGFLVVWPGLYAGFGFSTPVPYVGLLLAGMILQAAAVFAAPVPAALSRRFEREADRYVESLVGSSVGLCRALKKMAKDNLTNLHPHPFYVALYYSHPPIVERLERLGCEVPRK